MVMVEPRMWRRSGSVGRTPKLCKMRKLANGARVFTYVDWLRRVESNGNARLGISPLRSPNDEVMSSGAARMEV